jgi:hypothetical protein
LVIALVRLRSTPRVVSSNAVALNRDEDARADLLQLTPLDPRPEDDRADAHRMSVERKDDEH